MPSDEIVVVGSGPNGLACAITLAQKGLPVTIYEAHAQIGGGLRSYELTLPGFTHDMCAAIHPLSYSSPFFSNLPLKDGGLKWITPKTPVAHPFDNEEPVTLDEENFSRFFAKHWSKLQKDILVPPFHFPHHPYLLSQFAFYGLRSAKHFCKRYPNERLKALFAGLAAHCFLPLDQSLTAGFGLILATLGHLNGWPLVQGGSQNLANALAAYFTSLGGKIVTNTKIETLPRAKATFFDTSPQAIPGLKPLKYRYGPGIFKMDWALNAPIPWKDKKCFDAATVHLGGSFEEIALAEKQIWQNIHPEKPFIILAQPTLFDPTRAPPTQHTAWAYCHVPAHSDVDMSKQIESQIERFAPGFRQTILAKHTKTAKQMQEYNPNYVGGDINGGVQDLWQHFFRPKLLNPYKTKFKNVYLCSSSTPPGGGVHGMCGYNAAKSYLNSIQMPRKPFSAISS